MGLGCKPIGKMKRIMARVENDREKEKQLAKKKKKDTK